ncbi:MAG: transglutaminase family protein [Dehalococcoidia bacterium]
MRWKIDHSLSYYYSQPIVLGTQNIRLRARADTRQQVLRFELNIKPSPSLLTNHTDSENNAMTTAWFQGEHQSLEIASHLRVETSDSNPFDFILTEPAMTHLPLTYQEPDRSLLGMYHVLHQEGSPELDDFLKPVLIQAEYETVPFLSRLSTHICNSLRRENRKRGDPWAPEKTLQKGKGTCRDYAWLYIVACRSLGLAARFVSGYHVPLSSRERPELHSWAEVFMPGAGWIGFDPSLGLVVSNRHIALAASYDPARTAPSHGMFWGKDIKSRLETAITINSLE